jgi:hypothetical protein
MIPILSKQPSLRLWSRTYVSSCKYCPRRALPEYQNAASHMVIPNPSNTQATCRCLLSPASNLHPAPEITECITSAGVTITRRNSSDGSVIFRASVLVAGFIVFDISQRISSARTAERAILDEKVMLARVREVMRVRLDSCGTSRDEKPGN